MMYAIGIDVGGTKIAAGLVGLADGQVRYRMTAPTRADRGGESVFREVEDLAKAVLALAGEARLSVGGIGVGVCELVDPQGQVTSNFTVAWKGMPVREQLSGLLTLLQPPSAPNLVVVEADVRAQAVAEARYGAGRPYNPFVFINVGTGISSCLVQGGVPFAGARGNALVLATAPLSLPLPDGGWVNHELEPYASGLGIATRFGAARAEQVIEAAGKGDAVAQRILHTGGAALGNSVAFLANVLDPAAIIVGGGLGSADGVYWDSLIDSTRRHIWSEDTRTLPILHAKLGGDAGLIGAAASVQVLTQPKS